MLQKLGKTLLFALVLLSSACRKDYPPAISIICTLTPAGGGACVTFDGKRVFLKPSEMNNFWASTQEDMKNLLSWCYRTSPETIEHRMDEILQIMHAPLPSPSPSPEVKDGPNTAAQ